MHVCGDSVIAVSSRKEDTKSIQNVACVTDKCFDTRTDGRSDAVFSPTVDGLLCYAMRMLGANVATKKNVIIGLSNFSSA